MILVATWVTVGFFSAIGWYGANHYVIEPYFPPPIEKKVEEKINLGWNGTNKSGFSALPGGYLDENGWGYWIGGYAGWWSLEVSSRPEQGFGGSSYVMCLGNYDSWLPESWESGRSVRCIKD